MALWQRRTPAPAAAVQVLLARRGGSGAGLGGNGRHVVTSGRVAAGHFEHPYHILPAFMSDFVVGRGPAALLFESVGKS